MVGTCGCLPTAGCCRCCCCREGCKKCTGCFFCQALVSWHRANAILVALDCSTAARVGLPPRHRCGSETIHLIFAKTEPILAARSRMEFPLTLRTRKCRQAGMCCVQHDSKNIAAAFVSSTIQKTFSTNQPSHRHPAYIHYPIRCGFDELPGNHSGLLYSLYPSSS